MVKRLMAATLCLVLVLTAASCIHNPQSTNPQVVNVVRLLDGENTCNTIAHGLQQANATLKNLQATEPEYYAMVHPKLVQISQLNDKANQAILDFKHGNTKVDWQSALVAVAQGAGDPASLTAFGFKNPQTQQLVQLGFATLESALSLAATYGGK